MWKLLQCAVQGRGHEKSNIPCQDKTYSFSSNGVNSIALADGAGSATLSHFGAERVTKAICDLFANKFNDYFLNQDKLDVKNNILKELLLELSNIAKEKKCDIYSLASTLLVVSILNNKYIILHIGDGVIGYLKNNEIEVISKPENGEFVNTTTFVTSKDALKSMKLFYGDLDNINGFVLMSDGTETSLYSKSDNKLSPVIKKMMTLSQLVDISYLQKELVDSFEEVVKKRTNDDCSIAMIVKSDDEFHGYNNLSKLKKIQLLGLLNNDSINKRISRYDEILKYTDVPKNLKQIAVKIHLKEKYVKKYLNVLLEKNFISVDNGLYQTRIRLDD